MQALSRREWVVFIGAIGAAALLMYGRALFFDFVFWDDPLLVTQNPTIQGISFWHIRQAFTTYDPDLYVPLTLLSYQLNFLIGGLHPFIYHLTNILLHVANAALVGWIALLLSRDTLSAAHRKGMAIIVALLFLVHPINVEAVAWVSARKDLLSSFFFLLSLGTYLRIHDQQDGSRTAPTGYIGSIIFYVLGLLSKVSIVALPVILLLTDWYRGIPLKKSVTRTIPFFALSVIFGIVSVFGKMGGQATLFAKFLIGMKATVFSLWHLVWPFGYSVIYPFNDVVTLTRLDIVLPLLAVIIISVATTMFRKRYPTVFFGWWWFVVLLAPSFLTAEKTQDTVSMLYLTSDRYAYLAAIGVFFLAARILHVAARTSLMTARAVSGGTLLLLAVIAFVQVGVWNDTESLLRHSLSLYPRTAIAHNNLGAFYNSRGQTEEAKQEYALAAESGGTGDVWFNLGVAAMTEKRTPEAIAAFTKALELRPDFALAHLNLGALLLDSGRLQEAVDHLLAAQKLDPGNVAVYLNLGIALEKGNNVIDAVRAYERALQLDPENAYANERLRVLP